MNWHFFDIPGITIVQKKHAGCIQLTVAFVLGTSNPLTISVQPCMLLSSCLAAYACNTRFPVPPHFRGHLYNGFNKPFESCYPCLPFLTVRPSVPPLIVELSKSRYGFYQSL
jgi:hypothetical protein